jgi:hypothetical protein
MNDHGPARSAFEVRAWYAQLAVAAKTPGLAQYLILRTGEILPRFVAHYRRLRALPRRVRRAIERRRSFSLAALALLLALCAVPARAATIHVDGDACELADAIVAANFDAEAGGCSAGEGSDVIVLDANVTLAATLPSVTSPVTLQAGLGSILDGAGIASPCLDVAAGGDLLVSGLTVRNSQGAGIQAAGPLTLDHSTVSGNLSSGVSASNAVVTIRYSTISGNVGNGIETYCDDVIGTATTVTSSTISGNGRWGIVFDGHMTVDLERCTVSGNQDFGIMGFFSEHLSIGESTVTGNWNGLLLYGDGSNSLSIHNTLITGTYSVALYDVVVSRDEWNLFGQDGNPSVTGFTPGAADVIPPPGILVDDIVAPLADNGGPTATHALLPLGPAVDRVPADDPTCAGTTDQRGLPRPEGALCDIGSFELEASPTVGGSIRGFAVRQAMCRNRTTRGSVKDASGSAAWDCEALGLDVTPGDTVDLRASGTVDDTGTRVGGSVTGVTVLQVYCKNLSTGQQVQSSSSAVAWDCFALGMAQQPGDRVQTGAIGTVAGSGGGRRDDRGTASARSEDVAP